MTFQQLRDLAKVAFLVVDVVVGSVVAVCSARDTEQRVRHDFKLFVALQDSRCRSL